MARNKEMVYSYFPRLHERRSSAAGYLSGGEQQMLAIGRALMTQPKLLMLDEPSLGLAPFLVAEIFQIISRINREEGLSVLLVEQNAVAALEIVSHGYLIESGRVVMALPESAPRAYRLKVGNADLFRNSTEPGTSPNSRCLVRRCNECHLGLCWSSIREKITF